MRKCTYSVFFCVLLLFLPLLVEAQDGKILSGSFVVSLLSENPFDEINSITQDEYGNTYILGSIDGERKLIRSIAGDWTFLDINLENVSFVYYTQDHLFFYDSTKAIRQTFDLISEALSLSKETSKAWTTKSLDKREEVIYFDAKKILSKVSKVYFDPVNDKEYFVINEDIYTISDRSIFNYSLFEGVNIQPRFAYPVINDRILVGFYEYNMLLLAEGESFVDICKLPINSQNRQTRQYYHASASGNSVYLTDNYYKVSKLNLESGQVRLYNSLNKLGLRFKNNTSLRDGTILFGSIEGSIVHFDAVNEEVIKIYHNKLQNTYRFYEAKDGLVWVGLSNGLGIIDRKTEVFYSAPELWGGIDIRNLGFSGFAEWGSNMIITTYNSGVLECDLPAEFKNSLVDGNDVTWSELNFKQAKKFQELEAIEIEHIRVVNDDLILKTDRKIHHYRDSQYIVYSPENGYNGDMYNYFFRPFPNGDITLPTMGGFIRFNKISNDPYLTDRYSIASVSEGEIPLQNTYLMNHKKEIIVRENYTYLSIELVDKWSNSKVSKSQYFTDKQSPIKSQDKRVIFANRTINKHNLSIYPYYQVDGNIPYSITIDVRRPWYKTWLFRAVLVLFISGLLVFLLSLIQSSKRQKRKIKALETESLRSYMNPHFISNSLNSINYYILKNNRETASNYIIKFSKLIRRILNNSDQEFISIKEELESLAMYIEMEQMRFEDKFVYTIKIDPDVELHKEIPSFILQPIVENAIWHGLMQDTSQGQLCIEVAQKGSQIIIQIIDDGIGMEKAKLRKSKSATNRKSYGVQLIKKRLDILNHLYKHKNEIVFIDRKSENSEGTRVIIKLNYLKK